MSSEPSRDQIRQFLLGQLSSEELEDLAFELERSPAAAQLAADLEAELDSLGAAFRLPPAPGPDPSDPAYAKAIERLRKKWEGQVTAGSAAQGGADPASSAGVPRQVGSFQLLTKLGQGGMGTVHLARHERLGRMVALKLLAAHRARPEWQARFEREIKAVGRLNHPNIVQALDAGDANGVSYLAMELVDGVDLSKLIRRQGPLSVADSCEMIRQAACGLQHVHEHGFVHRDIKPSNLMLGQNGVVKILDLGLALLRQRSPSDELTAPDQLMGTLDYIAPEQIDDTRSVDIRADLYSLGCTLYKMLTGQAAFPANEFDSPSKKILAHTQRVPVPVRSLRPEVPEELAAVLERMLAKNPAERFQSPREVSEALQTFTAGCDLAALAARHREATDDSVQTETFSQASRHTPDLSLAETETSAEEKAKPEPPGVRRASGYWIAAGGCALALAALAASPFLLPNAEDPAQPDANQPLAHVAATEDEPSPPGDNGEEEPQATNTGGTLGENAEIDIAPQVDAAPGLLLHPGSKSLDSARDVAIGPSGRIYVTGTFGGSVDFDPGPDETVLQSRASSDVFVLCLKPNGKFAWVVKADVDANATGYGIAVDAEENVFVGGMSSRGVFGLANIQSAKEGAAFFWKLDKDGTAQWAQFVPRNNIHDVAVDADGNVYGIARHRVVVNPQTVNHDVFVYALDPQGKILWEREIGGPQDEMPGAVTVDAKGNVYLTGAFDGRAKITAPPGAALNATDSDTFIVKLNSRGHLVWARSLSVEKRKKVPSLSVAHHLGVGGQAIAVDEQGNVYTGGGFGGTMDADPGEKQVLLSSGFPMGAFLSKLDREGRFVWAGVIHGQSGSATLNDLTLDADGNWLFTGGFNSRVDIDPGPKEHLLQANGRSNAYVVKLDPQANLRWASTFQGQGAKCRGLVADAQNNVIVCGEFRGEVDFDPGQGKLVLESLPRKNPDNPILPPPDAFVVRLNSRGQLRD